MKYSQCLKCVPWFSTEIPEETRKPEKQQESPAAEIIRDSSGRPLFGGLRALKATKPSSDEPSSEEIMPEQPISPQLKEIVNKHEQHVREYSL